MLWFKSIAVASLWLIVGLSISGLLYMLAYICDHLATLFAWLDNNLYRINRLLTEAFKSRLENYEKRRNQKDS